MRKKPFQDAINIGPKELPILCISGAHGSGKSRLTALLRAGGYAGHIIETNATKCPKTYRPPYSRRELPVVYLEITGLK